jgi:peptide/nickel transport system permease protein
MIPVVLGVTILVFTIMYFIPGDPVKMMLGSDASVAQIVALRQKLGLNDPYLVRLGKFIGGIVFHFDFGNSWVYNTPVTVELLHRFPRTLTIAAICMALQIFVGIPLGIIAAVDQNGIGDRIAMFIALFGISLPNFWIAMMLVLLFSVKLGWLPPYGIAGFKYYILPCVANAFPGIATQARQTRSSMLEVIRSDYITTARAKGLDERTILWRHALKNALLPMITITTFQCAAIIMGNIFIETVFSWPGIGFLTTQALTNRDLPLLEGIFLLDSLITIGAMLLADILSSVIDPRIRMGTDE